ncbi:DUF6292 family protein [Actinokineospora sp.]|uniref:DUF6292 family protein n=1 Tax=Actinokineospora sp. TaxID=1872133 RepID=UPI003D6AA3E2
MDIYQGEHAELGLRRYVEAIARGLGVEAAASVCEMSPPANAYIALTDRVPGFPARDFALTWDEIHGWAATVETGSGEDLIALAYLLGDVLPAPADVVEFARDILGGRYPRHPAATSPYLRRPRAARARLLHRLALYTEPTVRSENLPAAAMTSRPDAPASGREDTPRIPSPLA